MKLKKGKVHLLDKIASTPYDNHITYVDVEDNIIVVPYSLLFGLYDIVQFHMEKNGWDFEEFKNHIYAKD